MKKEILKGKTIEVTISNKSYLGHLDKDIIAAIEWLKEEIYKESKTCTNWIDDKIDKAFDYKYG